MVAVTKSRSAFGWEHFPHVADIGVRGWGKTIDEAFEQAAIALTEVICDLAKVQPVQQVHIHCEAPDHEILLVDWLNSLIYEMATRRVLFSRFEVGITGCTLKAVAWGEVIDRKRHQPAVETKGATYTALRVAKDANGTWVAQCIVDV
ncbi:MAG: archease [Gammaproteobacteria bacterium]|nr:archease [Gammaproteobacteria bacterium]